MNEAPSLAENQVIKTKVETNNSVAIEQVPEAEVTPPGWFAQFAKELSENAAVTNLREYIATVEGLSLTELNQLIGGNFAELPYEFMRKVLPDGSDDDQVATIFRSKREEYLEKHPEEKQGGNAAEGVIGQDGRFMQIDDWNSLSPSDKFIVLVGPTCFHFNTDVPGYGSEPSVRARL